MLSRSPHGSYLFEKVAMTKADLQDICSPSVDYFASLLYERGAVSSLLKDIKIPSICVRSLFSRWRRGIYWVILLKQSESNMYRFYKHVYQYLLYYKKWLVILLMYIIYITPPLKFRGLTIILVKSGYLQSG